ncbi:MAG: pyruvate kinase [Helicobacteraceae bacterium]|jgi:pyruvate kinase|nr:pyruvate kinase [Helicobacteraceae bacterium]
MLDKKLMQSALQEIDSIRAELLLAREEVALEHPNYQSLLNLKQYLILRSKDRTNLQDKLFLMSLSSLGRSYAHVAGSIDTLYDQLRSSLGLEELTGEEMAAVHHLTISDSIEFASKNSTKLFGGKVSSKLSKQSTAIMVTLPSHAADNRGELIRSLAERSVNIFRINTAHDTPEVWRAMAEVITKINEERDESNRVKIFVDLAGLKIRTGKIRKLDLPVEIGSNKREKKVEIVVGNGLSTRAETVDERTQLKAPARLSVNKNFFKKIKKERSVKVVDVNGKKAFITILELNDRHAKGIIDKKVYVDASAKISRKHEHGNILNIETQVDPIRLFRGDLLVITERDTLGRSAQFDSSGKLLEPAMISCSLRGIAARIKVGEKVFIDDGKIGLEVIEHDDQSIRCKVVQAKAGGTLLKEEKGINFPDTHVKTAALTETDRNNLLSVIEFADNLSISFCQSAEDISDLQKLLLLNGRSDIGIIAKIETKRGVANMPKILEQLLVWQKSGVMIARGDLAIEVGFVNMAQTQEALLDICSAAHIPVIWATQVLESQMKNNLPSRAEVTDAAMAGRAECVMLNKGAFATDTIDVLIHILDDMHSIYKKNRQLLKKETLW